MFFFFKKTLFSSQLRKNMFSGVTATIINTVVILVSYPIYLHYLGYEKLGIWMVLSTVLTFVQMCNLGMGPAVTKLVAEEYGRGNTQGIQSYVITALWTLTATGCIALAVLLFFKRPIIGLFKLNPENAAIALRFLPYMGLLTVYAFLVQILTATLSGLGRMDQVNYRDSVCRAVALGATVILLIFGYGIMSLLAGIAVNYLLIHVTSIFLIRRIIKLQILRFNWDVKRFRILFSFGGMVLGGSIINMLFSPFNKLILSRYAGVAALPIYEIAFTGSMQVRGLIEAAFRALVPEISRIGADMTTLARDRMSQIYQRSMKLIFLFGTPIFATLAILAPILLKLWLGNRFVGTIPGVFRIMLLGTFLSLLGVPAYYFLMGTGFVHYIMGAHIIQAILNLIIVLLILLTLTVTTNALAVAASIAMTGASFYLIVQKRHITNKSN